MSKIEFKYAAARPCCGFLLDHILTDTLKLNALTTFARAEEKTRQKIDLRTAWGMVTESTGQNESGLADYEGVRSGHQAGHPRESVSSREANERLPASTRRGTFFETMTAVHELQMCGPQRTRLIDEALARGRI